MHSTLDLKKHKEKKGSNKAMDGTRIEPQPGYDTGTSVFPMYQ